MVENEEEPICTGIACIGMDAGATTVCSGQTCILNPGCWRAATVLGGILFLLSCIAQLYKAVKLEYVVSSAMVL